VVCLDGDELSNRDVIDRIWSFLDVSPGGEDPSYVRSVTMLIDEWERVRNAMLSNR
jgi:hypothetical protein